METEEEETPKGEQPPSPLRAKPHPNIREAAVPEETRQVQDELNRRPANAANLNWNEAKSSKSKSLGDRPSRETKRKPNGEEHPDDAVDRGASPKTPPPGKRPFQPGGNKSTQRQTGTQGEPAVLGKELSQFQASLRVKTDTTGGTERWPQEGEGKTRMTVSKPGIDTNPERATSPKKTSQARI